MKKIIFFFVSAAFFFVRASFPVNAQATDINMENPHATASVMSEELDYTLPYPGILPDHPLYVFKKIRDSVMWFLMRDPIKRIEFSLLQSDKHLATAISLIDIGKINMAGEAITQSQHAMEQSIQGVIAARNNGIVVPSHIILSMERSTVKHKQRIDEIIKNVQEDRDGLFQKASDTFLRLAAEVSALRTE